MKRLQNIIISFPQTVIRVVIIKIREFTKDLLFIRAITHFESYAHTYSTQQRDYGKKHTFCEFSDFYFYYIIHKYSIHTSVIRMRSLCVVL